MALPEGIPASSGLGLPSKTSSTLVAQHDMPAATLLQPVQDSSTRTPERNVHYTVFIRLPFCRGEFEDPPPVRWDSAKDKQLWKLISNSSNSSNLDWQSMSTRFDVPLAFLLQQAAWLYERHFEGMRAQMKKLGAGTSPQSIQQSDGSIGGVSATPRTNSKGTSWQLG